MENRTSRRIALALFCLCLLAYGYFIPRGAYHNPDSRLALTYSLVERATLDIGPYAAFTDDKAFAGGRYYTDKAPGVSFALAPLYAIFRVILGETLAAAGDVPGAADRFLTRWLLTVFGIGLPAAAFATWLFVWLARDERQISPRLAIAVGYALGSPAWLFSQAAFGHVPAGMCLFLACAAVEGRPGRDRLAVAGALLGTAVLFEYPAAVPALVIALYGVWQAARRLHASPPPPECPTTSPPGPLSTEWRGGGAAGGEVVPRRHPLPLRWKQFAALSWLAIGALPPLALLAAYQQAAFGTVWSVGYAHLLPGTAFAAGQAQGLLGVTWPDVRVALALLVSPYRGLLVHAPWLALVLPGAALWWRSGRRTEAAAAALVGLALLAINSGYVFWEGGASWGPRHLVPALPFLARLALPAVVAAPRTGWALAGTSSALTFAAAALRAQVDPSVGFPIRDVLIPAILAGQIENNWGQVLGLSGWRGVVPLVAAGVALAAWSRGLGRAYGWLLAALWALWAAAALGRDYVDYAEGYYLYLGARLAAGARLYAEAASTQPPLLPAALSLLWRVQPDVYLPRLLALGCFVAAAVLAGALAGYVSPSRRAIPLATALGATLALGAGAPQVLDANAVLAPLGALVCLLWLRGTAGDGRAGAWMRSGTGWAAAAGLTAAASVAVKLTSLLFALAPLVAFPRNRSAAAIAYGLAFAAGTLGQAAFWLAHAGGSAFDGVLGELEMPVEPLGPLLAYLQLLWLDAIACAFAVAGWRAARRWRAPRALLMYGLLTGLMPLYTLHHGTFVGIARPAEPFIAAFAAAGVVAGARWLSRRARAPAPFAFGVLAALALGVQAIVTLSQGRPAGDDPRPVLAWIAPVDDEAVLAPPYHAALAGKRALHDYADWTVLGTRASRGAPREAAIVAAGRRRIEQADLPVAAVDFRIRYVPEWAAALDQRYVEVAEAGDNPARNVRILVPR